MQDAPRKLTYDDATAPKNEIPWGDAFALEDAPKYLDVPREESGR